MQEISAELARVTVEHKRLQRQAQKERSRQHKQQEHAFLTATIAFCHEPTAGPTIAEATLRKCPRVMDEEVANFYHKITTRFLETPVDTLAEWLDWSDIPRTIQGEAQRLVEEARLLHWIGEQNSAQSVAPPPQFVWEKRCALAIDKNSSSHLPSPPLPSPPSPPILSSPLSLPPSLPVLGLPKSRDGGFTLGRILGSAERTHFGGRVFVFI